MTKNYWGVGSIKPKESKVLEKPRHRIIIQDQSGSMYWAVKQVAEDIIAHLHEIPLGDLVTIGYFSGVGDFRWWIIGYRLTAEKDYDHLAELLRKNAVSRGTTCFSEILADTRKVIDTAASLAEEVDLTFLTDGHPVVPSQEKERTAIFKALAALTMVSQALIVGYGDYYNRPLLSEMAAALGGILQHAEEITDFGVAFGKVTVSKNRRRVTFDLPKGAEVAFNITDTGAAVVFEVKNHKVSAPSDARLYFLSREEGVGIDVQDTEDGDVEKSAYASALVLAQMDDLDGAVEKLSQLGDVALVRAFGNAITNAEFGRAQSLLQAAVVDKNARYLEGKEINCAPDPHAFDLLDMLTLLQEDEEAKFYPYHPAWQYRRIGRKSEPKEGYPTFVPDKSVGVPIGTLTWSSDELNLSVLATIPGAVELNDGARALALGFAPTYPTKIFRNYALVANALPNVKVLPVSVGANTYTALVAKGMIPSSEIYDPARIYELNIASIPVVNRHKSRGNFKASEIALHAVLAELYAAHLKTLNSLRKEYDPNKDVLRKSELSAEQEDFLKANGIKNGAFSPDTIQAPSTDVLPTRLFEVKVGGFSSLPKLEALRQKAAKGKPYTASENAMALGLEDFEKNAPKGSVPEILQWLDMRITQLKARRREQMQFINAARFGIALGGKWFADLKSRTENAVKVQTNGATYDVTFDVRSIDKPI